MCQLTSILIHLCVCVCVESTCLCKMDMVLLCMRCIPSSMAMWPFLAAVTNGESRHTVSPLGVVVRCCTKSRAVMSWYSTIGSHVWWKSRANSATSIDLPLPLGPAKQTAQNQPIWYKVINCCYCYISSTNQLDKYRRLHSSAQFPSICASDNRWRWISEMAPDSMYWWCHCRPTPQLSCPIFCRSLEDALNWNKADASVKYPHSLFSIVVRAYLQMCPPCLWPHRVVSTQSSSRFSPLSATECSRIETMCEYRCGFRPTTIDCMDRFDKWHRRPGCLGYCRVSVRLLASFRRENPVDLACVVNRTNASLHWTTQFSSSRQRWCLTPPILCSWSIPVNESWVVVCELHSACF